MTKNPVRNDSATDVIKGLVLAIPVAIAVNSMACVFKKMLGNSI